MQIKLNIKFTIEIILWLFIATLFLPEVDASLDESMPDHVVTQMGGLLLLGFLAGRLRWQRNFSKNSVPTITTATDSTKITTQIKTSANSNESKKNKSSKNLSKILDNLNPYGLSTLIFFVGTITFWMIPRSLDLSVSYNAIDMLMQFQLVLASFLLGLTIHKVPFVLKTAIAIYGLSMILSAGLTYKSFESLICATYDLDMQKETGVLLLKIFPALFITFLILAAKNLLQFASKGKTD